MSDFREVFDGYCCTCPHGCEYSDDDFVDFVPPCSDCVYLMSDEDLNTFVLE